MNGAAFFLAVNFLVAMSFGIVFIVIAGKSRSRSAALWIGSGFVVASLSAACELLVAYTGAPKPWAIGAFMTALAGMMSLTVGISILYGRRLDLRVIVVFLGLCLLLCLAIYDLPRGTPLQAFSYQSPFAFTILTGAFIVFRSQSSSKIDRFLGILLLATGLHFFAKAELAILVGSGSTAADYVRTNYALISQSSTAVLVVGVGLTLLATLVLEIIARERSESEIDALSGLANRRGLDRQVHALLTEQPHGGHVVVLCDFDNFKKINDKYGHHVGDLVIQGFGIWRDNLDGKRDKQDDDVRWSRFG